jgi:hypothetical protein
VEEGCIMITVKRSGSKKFWHVLYGSVCLAVRSNKAEATELADELNKKYRLSCLG